MTSPGMILAPPTECILPKVNTVGVNGLLLRLTIFCNATTLCDAIKIVSRSYDEAWLRDHLFFDRDIHFIG